MPDGLASPFTAAEAVTVALAVLLAVLLALLAYRAWKRSRTTPEERERQRRRWLVASGKMGDATLVEIRDDLVFFSYAVRGVEYTASQDVSRLAQRVPSDLSAMGAVSVKYDPRNPANSIVIAEEWTGLRAGLGYHGENHHDSRTTP
jgi:glutamine synthetase adenylyltransferase